MYYVVCTTPLYVRYAVSGSPLCFFFRFQSQETETRLQHIYSETLAPLACSERIEKRQDFHRYTAR
jgi:hypothetical protein